MWHWVATPITTCRRQAARSNGLSDNKCGQGDPSPSLLKSRPPHVPSTEAPLRCSLYQQSWAATEGRLVTHALEGAVSKPEQERDERRSQTS